MLKKMIQSGPDSVRAGWLLGARCDPWGTGYLPGFGDPANLEPLVEASFRPAEAVQIVTRNGARILGKDRETGFIASARHADLVIARGDPVRAPKAMHEVVTVFKGALADDCMKLRRAAKGLVDSL